MSRRICLQSGCWRSPLKCPIHSKLQSWTRLSQASQRTIFRASPASLGTQGASAKPLLGGRRAFVLHASPSSWYTFMKSENNSLWLKQGLPGHDTVKDQKSQVFKTLRGSKRIQSRQSMLKCYHLQQCITCLSKHRHTPASQIGIHSRAQRPSPN